MKKQLKSLCALTAAMIIITGSAFADTRVIQQGNPDIKEMALTFDDGYNVEKINKIKAVLNKYDVKGTFFFVGSFMASHKEIVRELEADGHMVVSHSFSHPDFTKRSDKSIVGEMENTKIVYNKATDKKILPYFRPPYGAYNDHVLSVLGKNHDLYVVMWTIDTLDWKGIPASSISNEVISKAGNGKIALMHTTQHINTDKALDAIITGLHAKGYKLVRIDEMISKLPEKEKLPGISYLPPSNEPSTNNAGDTPASTADVSKTESSKNLQDSSAKSNEVVLDSKESGSINSLNSKREHLFRLLLCR